MRGCFPRKRTLSLFIAFSYETPRNTLCLNRQLWPVAQLYWRCTTLIDIDRVEIIFKFKMRMSCSPEMQ